MSDKENLELLYRFKLDADFKTPSIGPDNPLAIVRRGINEPDPEDEFVEPSSFILPDKLILPLITRDGKRLR